MGSDRVDRTLAGRSDGAGTGAAADAPGHVTLESVAGVGWIHLFRDTDESAVMAVLRECEVLRVPAGAALLQPGDANSSIYLLMAGEMAAHLDTALRLETGIPIHPGETVGELSAIDGKPVSALVVALTDASLLTISQELFWNRLSHIPGVTRNLLASLSERMRRGNDVMLEAQRKQLALEHLRQELEIARQLQAGMLPMRGLMFPERRDIDVVGVMEPASEIGGDFFDAFFVDDRHLFFCIGDVSGHGIPAALFMARTIGLLRVAAIGTRRPERVLQRINEQLSAGNESNMFVTLFCGFVDVTDGRLNYTNGGHCAPVVVAGGQPSLLCVPRGPLVGVIPGLRYAAKEWVLEEGATLVCFTDGVTEAETEAGRQFSETRLLEAVAAGAGDPVDIMLESIRRAVSDFTGDRPLGDDCTLLALRRPRRA